MLGPKLVHVGRVIHTVIWTSPEVLPFAIISLKCLYIFSAVGRGYRILLWLPLAQVARFLSVRIQTERKE